MDGQVFLAYDYPVLGAFWTVLFIVGATMWLILLFRVIADIFRDHAMSGTGKAAWLLCVLFLPFLGVFLYVIARGGSMNEREVSTYQDRQRSRYARMAPPAHGGSDIGDLDELAKLADLKAHGDISEAEYAEAKERILH
ncbi:SHOCT domain-containing protein [Streptomyces sp. V4-01]|uniref:SHOCT domain-containing protein n=1 Tax=Actinacidiphila polyblastidii TaxID=3110430 RepID=A0ABU7PIP6_9ACTN|nr:SHOCT domain-containing protein [Streptomyces sp. V4-01]